MSKRDDEIIAKYRSDAAAETMRKIAKALGGIDRVEGDYFIMGNGTPVRIQQRSMLERWAEEDKIIAARGTWS